MLRIRVLGGLELELEGRRLATPAARRARLLLGWLALNPGPQPRGALAARMWPDVLDESARTSLRNAAWAVRKALGDGAEAFLLATRETLELAGEPGVWVDARAFAGLAEAGRLEEAVELARGEVLAGLDADWIDAAREDHRDALGDMFGRLAAEAPDTAAGVRWARRRAALDPLSEEASRAVMERLAAAGDRAEALAVFERHAERLRVELRMAPSAKTRELAERLRAGSPDVPVGDGTEPGHPGLPVPPRLASAAEAPMVGREPELEVLHAAWRLATAGPARIAALAGDAGIGKTRLAAALGAEAARGGAIVLYGAADSDAVVPYQPFVEAVRHYLRTASAADRATRLRGSRADLGGLVPEAADIAAASPAQSPEEGRARMFEAVGSLLSSLAADAPVLLVIDDLHWADGPSVQLLKHTCRSAEHARLLILLLYRRDEAPGHVVSGISGLRRSQPWHEIGVPPLSPEHVALVAAAAGAADAAEALHEETAGNPFFVCELLRHLAEGGRLDSPPDHVREVVERRVARLGEGSAELLRHAAVLGADFSTEALARLADRSGEDVGIALDAATAAGILTDRPGAGASCSFSHALLRETLYSGLGARRRAQLHHRAALALEGLGAGVAELAHHFLAGAAAGGSERAAEYAVQAAERAESAAVYEEAIDLYGRLLDILDPDDPRRRRLAARKGLAAQALYHVLLMDTAGQTERPAGSTSPTIS